MPKRRKEIEIERTGFEGLLKVHYPIYGDGRGEFKELWRSGQFPEFVQANMSLSYKGVIRGLHYQRAPYAQGKLVFCVEGHINDVVVDLRPGKTFLKHYSMDMTADGPALYVPPGFAHGFQALCMSKVLYMVTSAYSVQHEAGLRWDDPRLGIKWEDVWSPHGDFPKVSDKDRGWPLLK